MKAEQKKLLFRNSVAVAGSLFFAITVAQTRAGSGTGQEKYTVMSITPEGDYAPQSGRTAFNAIYLPFKPGAEYSKQEFIDYAITYAMTLAETSQEDSAALIYWLDIGTTTTPTAGSITSSGATISWTNTNPTKNTGIRVYKKLTSAADSTYVLSYTATASATSRAITGLTTGTGYTVKIVPFNIYGESAGKTVAFTTS